ncbi:MAG TPA: PrsW family glutamic-type intramembrane protease, partial [Anaerolineaceae bacterium]|nr:PrsW family glutamic-type intramembrane protease [Anaerolineaceae bacterium]
VMQAPNTVSRRVVNLLLSNLASFFILAIFIGLAFAVSSWLKPVFSTTGLVITGVLMALVPAGVWLFFFYRQDRREPEPKGMVMQVFILGALLAAAIGIPLVEDGFNVSNWMYANPWVGLAASILVIGFIQEFLKYAAVRFSVYPTREFNERTDGVIYAIAAGLGFALVLNVSYIITSGGADLGTAAIRLTLTSLAQASFAGVSGYFLAREKLDRRPTLWMPLGLLLAALLNGVFFYLWGELSRATIRSSGAFVNPWAGLMLAAALALVTMAALTWLIQHDQARNPVVGGDDLPPFVADRKKKKGRKLSKSKNALYSALLVIALTVVAVFTGWLVENEVENQTRVVELSNISASYPSNWQLQKGMVAEDLLFYVSDPLKPALRYTVTQLALPADGKLDLLAMQRTIQRGGQLSMYRIFDQSPVEYKNADAGYMVHFAYVDARGNNSLPVVVEGVEYYLAFGEQVVLVTMEDDSKTFTLDQPRFMAFLDSIVVGGE